MSDKDPTLTHTEFRRLITELFVARSIDLDQYDRAISYIAKFQRLTEMENPQL